MSHHNCPDLTACTRGGDRWILNSVSDWTRKQFVCKCRKGLTQCVVMLVTEQFKTNSWWRECRGQTFRPEAFRKTSTTNLTDNFCFVWIYLLDGLSGIVVWRGCLGNGLWGCKSAVGRKMCPYPKILEHTFRGFLKTFNILLWIRDVHFINWAWCPKNLLFLWENQTF